MTTPAVSELLALSELATPGEWRASSGHVYADETEDRLGCDINCRNGNANDWKKNAAFITAAVNFIRSDAFRQMAEAETKVAELEASESRLKTAMARSIEVQLNAEAECAALRKDRDRLHAMLVLSAKAVQCGEGVSLGYYIEDIAPKEKAAEVNAYIDAAIARGSGK